MPRFTVITPTYNRAGFLPETIQSILDQTESDYEYIIIDDGSTDNTRQVVEPYLSDPRIRYLYQENGGESAAVNHGWALAKGEYFTQVNSDDPVLPTLLSEMGQALDDHPEAILAYCDFQFIDERGQVIREIHSPDWDFLYDLSTFSCYAAAPGTAFRRSALTRWQQLRRLDLRHINDVEMLWKMALEGDFLHVPKILATWRQHSGQISHGRYRAIPEIEAWFRRYFANPDLPEAVKACEPTCRKSIDIYIRALVEQGNLTPQEKRLMLYDVEKDAYLAGMDYANLQVGDNDLIGNKFNGHDLHRMLQARGVRACHFVLRKESDDADTFVIPTGPEQNYATEIMCRKEFLLTDLVHLHLIHNSNFDLNWLPMFCSLKPTVITLHDPFFLSGHCIYNGDCDKNLTCCADCEHLSTPFALSSDRSAFLFEQKRQAIQNANLSAIVASEWMEEKVRKSPIFQGKKIYRLPFGINQEIFCPRDITEAREALGVPSENLVILFRSDRSPFKGLETIKQALRELKCERPVTLLMVGENGLMKEFGEQYDLREYGWIKDDRKLVTLYQACDIFLMPSKQEAFGMMAVEAMSCAKPVLAVLGTSLPSVIHSPECGLAVEPEMYTQTLQRWVDQPQEREERGRKSQQFAQENYTLERYMQGMMAIYADVRERFTPSPNQQTVLSQMNWLCPGFLKNIASENTSNQETIPDATVKNVGMVEAMDPWKTNGSVLTYELCHSHSWRITKPIRAFQHARKARGAKASERLKIYRSYLKESAEDEPDDEVILHSKCWKVTKPMRAFHRAFPHRGSAKA